MRARSLWMRLPRPPMRRARVPRIAPATMRLRRHAAWPAVASTLICVCPQIHIWLITMAPCDLKSPESGVWLQAHSSAQDMAGGQCERPAHQRWRAREATSALMET